ncbi:hypothetical protein N0V90_004119 [Kalmusia sp. IMI 367209]|nr:hypothetical protein N0V90_004119 [Kalmusia sp. IMI 367209]
MPSVGTALGVPPAGGYWGIISPLALPVLQFIPPFRGWMSAPPQFAATVSNSACFAQSNSTTLSHDANADPICSLPGGSTTSTGDAHVITVTPTPTIKTPTPTKKRHDNEFFTHDLALPFTMSLDDMLLRLAHVNSALTSWVKMRTSVHVSNAANEVPMYDHENSPVYAPETPSPGHGRWFVCLASLLMNALAMVYMWERSRIDKDSKLFQSERFGFLLELQASRYIHALLVKDTELVVLRQQLAVLGQQLVNANRREATSNLQVTKLTDTIRHKAHLDSAWKKAGITRMASLQKSLEAVQKENSALIEVIKRQENNTNTDDHPVKTRQFCALQQDITSLKEDIAGLRFDTARMDKNITTVQQDTADLNKNFSNLQHEHASVDQSFTDLKHDNAIADNKITTLTQDLNKLTTHNKRYLKFDSNRMLQTSEDISKLRHAYTEMIFLLRAFTDELNDLDERVASRDELTTNNFNAIKGKLERLHRKSKDRIDDTEAVLANKFNPMSRTVNEDVVPRLERVESMLSELLVGEEQDPLEQEFF